MERHGPRTHGARGGHKLLEGELLRKEGRIRSVEVPGLRARARILVSARPLAPGCCHVASLVRREAPGGWCHVASMARREKHLAVCGGLQVAELSGFLGGAGPKAYEVDHVG